MSDSKSYKLTKCDLHLAGDRDKVDIRGIIAEFNWMESIDSPFVRLDIAILDSTDFDQQIYGTETLDIEFSTYASQGDSRKTARQGVIKATLKMYKIGNIIKRERAKMYVLHFAPEAMYKNETERVFGMYGAKNGKQDLVKQVLTKHLGISKRDIEIENHTSMNVLSPNWRPVDVIAYLTDKVSRNRGKGGGKDVGKRQAGFLFYQNRDGYHFKSIDFLCEQGPIAEYLYGQKNVNTNDARVNMFRIENIKFPDRANQLEKLRQGVYQTCTLGIVLPSPTDSYIPQPGANTSDVASNGTVSGPVVYKLQQIFTKASTLEKGFPYDPEVINQYENLHPTRLKFKCLPNYSHQTAQQPNGGAEEESGSILNAASYASQRWFLLNSHTLTVNVSGNTALSAGSVIKITMPESQQQSKKKLPKDRQVSGKYLIKGIKHTYTQKGMTTELYLCRDSMPVSK